MRSAAQATRVLATVLIAAGGGRADRSWVWPGTNWTWDRLNIATWGTNRKRRAISQFSATHSSCCGAPGPPNPACCSGFDNRTEIAFKEKFDMIFVDNLLNTPGCRVNTPEVCHSDPSACDTLEQCLAHRSAVAAPLKARARSGQKVLGYRGIVIAWWNYVTAANTDWWIKDPLTGEVHEGVLDWRVPAAADYFVTKVIGESTYTDPHIDGVFVDSGFMIAGGDFNLTLADRKALMRAELAAFHRIATAMAAHGKVIVVSLKNHFGNVSDQQGARLCPPGMAKTNRTPCYPFPEDYYFDVLGSTGGFIPFRQFNIPSRDFGDAAHGGNDTIGCAAAVENLAIEAKSGPAFATNNDGAPSGGPPNSTITWHGQHLVSLAAFMLAAEEGSYFSSGHGWTDDGNTFWWPEYDKKVGRPLGPYKREGFVFSRSFEHVDVRLDCGLIATADGGAADFHWRV